MKPFLALLLILICVIAAPIIMADKPLTIRWAYDIWREKEAERKAQDVRADEFNRTNTNPNRMMNRGVFHGYIEPSTVNGTNTIEAGFRSDGVMVWRILPEALNKK